MILSCETYRLREKFNSIEAVRLIKDAGFDAYDHTTCELKGVPTVLGDDYLEQAIELKKYADSIGIPCNQAHAPFNNTLVIPREEFNTDNPLFLGIVRSIEVASVLGAGQIIIHAMKSIPEGEDLFDYTVAYYKAFLPYAEKFGVKVAVENLFDSSVPKFAKRTGIFGEPEAHCALVDAIDSEWVTGCLDIGHAYMIGVAPEDSIRALGQERLGALHVHDNFSIRDLHLLPYTGEIVWDRITDALAEIDYKGDMTLEIVGYIQRMPKELVPDALKLAAAVGRHLIKEVEGKRKSDV